MIRSLIAMPGRLMYDGHDPDLFDHFAVVAQKSNVYTIYDYASILMHLVQTWKIADRQVTGKAAKAQEYLCKQGERYSTLAEAVTEHLESQPKRPFSWIHNRKA
jgi:acyl-[acyl-carrier-protein] desaturase